MQRRHVKHQFTLQDRIIAWAKEVRQQAAELPPGPEQDMLLKKVRQAETDAPGGLGQLAGTTTAEIGTEAAALV